MDYLKKIQFLIFGFLGIATFSAIGFAFYSKVSNLQDNKGSNQQTSIQANSQTLETFLAAGVSVDNQTQDSIDKLDLTKIGQQNLSIARSTQALNSSINGDTYLPKQPIFGDGSTSKPYQIKNNIDPLCKQLQPIDVKTEFDKQTKILSLYWQSDNQTVIPYMHLIGYWFNDFDPSEKFNIELLELDEMIEWSQNVNESITETDAVKTLKLDLDSFNLFSNKAYYYLYARTVIGSTYIDCLYGDPDNNNQAYIFNLP